MSDAVSGIGAHAQGESLADAGTVDPNAAPVSAERPAPQRGWEAPVAGPTTLVLVRHGVTAHTTQRRFSGGVEGHNPPLSPEGLEQASLTGQWLKSLEVAPDVVISSPVLRTAETAAAVASHLGGTVVEDPAFSEMDFGAWDGLTFAEVEAAYPAQVQAWMGTTDVAPGGGESVADVFARVEAGLDAVLTAHRSKTVVLVSHVTPIKSILARALRTGVDGVFHFELAPASVSVLNFYDDGDDGDTRGILRLFNALPPARTVSLRASSRW